MAIIKNGILGGFKGKCAGLIGYKRLGKNIIQGNKKGGKGSINTQLQKMTYAMKLGKTFAYNAPASLLLNMSDEGMTKEEFWKFTQKGFEFCEETQDFFPYDLAKLSPNNINIPAFTDFAVDNVNNRISMRVNKVNLEPDPTKTVNCYFTIIQKNGSFVSQTNRLNQTFNAAFSINIAAPYREKELIILAIGKSNKTGLRGILQMRRFTVV